MVPAILVDTLYPAPQVTVTIINEALLIFEKRVSYFTTWFTRVNFILLLKIAYSKAKIFARVNGPCACLAQRTYGKVMGKGACVLNFNEPRLIMIGHLYVQQ